GQNGFAVVGGKGGLVGQGNGVVHRISFSVETPPFRPIGSDFIWEGRNPFQIRATHRATFYVSSCVLKRGILFFMLF
ncbi:TPA: hypothetical protein ACLUM7_001806, partial [Neisseria gonorrhoeae]